MVFKLLGEIPLMLLKLDLDLKQGLSWTMLIPDLLFLLIPFYSL